MTATTTDENVANQRELALRWDKIVRQIGIRYGGVRLEDFELHGTDEDQARQIEAIARVRDYLDELPQMVTAGRGCIFYGPSGGGKDMLMACMMREACRQGLNVEWRNGLDIYAEARDRRDNRAREAALVRSLAVPDVLGISDPVAPVGDLSPFQAGVLFRVVDARYRFRKPTWLTLNAADRAEASSRLGHATVDRLRERALAIHCDWPSYRQIAK